MRRAQALNSGSINGIETEFDIVQGTNLRKGLENYLREKFLRTFGSSWGMSNEMYMEYSFTDTCSVKISLVDKPEFSEGLQGLAAYAAGKNGLSPALIKQALDLIKKVLRGTYRYSDGEEQIVLDNGKYVKINFSSSGQQESVWIFNLLFYYLLQTSQVLFIIEEPESHLFPESQKYMTELIALISNCKHEIVLTTHSPYVLGTLNNLLYAKNFTGKKLGKANKIIPDSFWIDDLKFDSWFVKNGSVENCMDEEIHMIQNEKIDEISKVINWEFDELLRLQDTDEKGIS